MAGQNPPGSAASQTGSREAASPPPGGLDDTPLSPDDPSSLLDYVTHEDGSVTCKLCGEQVGPIAGGLSRGYFTRGGDTRGTGDQ